MSDSFADLWASAAPTKPAETEPKKKQYDAFSILSASQPLSTASRPSVARQVKQPQPSARDADAFSTLFASSLDASASPRTNMTMAALAQKAQAAQNDAVLAAPSGSSSPSLWDGLDALARPTAVSPRPPAHVPSVPTESAPPTTASPLLGDIESDDDDTFGIRNAHSADDILGDLGRPVHQPYSPFPTHLASTHVPSPPQRTTASPPPHVTGKLVEMGFSPAEARAALINTMSDSGFDVQAAAELLLSQASMEGSTPDSRDHEEHASDDREINRERISRRPPSTRSDTRTQSPDLSSTPPQSQSQIDITAEKLLSQASEIGRGMFSKANALWKEGKERAVKMYEERTTANAAGGVPASDGRPRWMRDHDHTGAEQRRPDPDSTAFRDDEVGGEERQHPPARRPPQSQLQPYSQPSQPEHQVSLFSDDIPAIAYQSPYRRGKPKTQEPVPTLFGQTISTSSQPTSQPPPPRTLTTTITLSALTSSTSHKSAGTDAYKRGDFPIALAAYTRALAALPPEHVLRVPILTNLALVRAKVGELRETIKVCEQAILIVQRFVGNTTEGGPEGVDLSFVDSETNFDEKTQVLVVGTGKVDVCVRGGASNGDLPASVDLIEGLSKAFRRRAEALEGLEKWEKARSTWEAVLGAEWAGTGMKSEAVKGVGRCRKMVEGSDGTSDAGIPSRSAPPRPRAKPGSGLEVTSRPKLKSSPSSVSSGASLSSSAAVAALRSADDAQKTEDAARLACKESVDTRLSAWKSSREGNIRALLTSLDENLLWPELGWRKVGMAEVVSKGQVKGAYMRAIARVHPDKLNTGNTTVEQRMIANGVFGTLNEAWNAFQQQ